MTKIIKLKESDIEKIVQNVISEEEVETNEQEGGSSVELSIAINPETKEIFIVRNGNTDSPEIYSTGTFYNK